MATSMSDGSRFRKSLRPSRMSGMAAWLSVALSTYTVTRTGQSMGSSSTISHGVPSHSMTMSSMVMSVTGVPSKSVKAM